MLLVLAKAIMIIRVASLEVSGACRCSEKMEAKGGADCLVMMSVEG